MHTKMHYDAPDAYTVSLRPLRMIAGSFNDGSLGDSSNNWNRYGNWDDDED